ncbi:hypothetical protein IKJ53_01215 [bacterium]|nr:hypothetical protein [bacterium]
MTKQERVIKMLNEQELLLGSVMLFFEDSNLILDNKAIYESLEKAYENNKIIQEEITY